MSNLLKVKLGVILCSAPLLLVMFLFNRNFYMEDRHIGWKDLQWDDFKGIGKPFTGYDASISSGIGMKYDSASRSWETVASMNSSRSWVRDATDSTSSLLRHEQYHFNISEVHARKLNYFIRSNPHLTDEDYRMKLAEERVNMARMQDAYDEESDHSLVRHMQSRWEYMIDSMLMAYAAESGWVTDQYSGATAFFASAPTFQHGLDSGNYAYRMFSTEKYNASFTLVSFQHHRGVSEISMEDITSYYLSDSLEIRSLEVDSTGDFNSFSVEVFDSTTRRYSHERWHQNFDYRYRARASYITNDEEALSGYRTMALSFLNSFDVRNTNGYWEEKMRGSEELLHVAEAEPFDKADDMGEACFFYGNYGQHGFLRGPFYGSDGSLLLAYDIIEHAASEIHEELVVANDKVYSFKTGREEHLFFVPADGILSHEFQFYAGYTLAKDTVKMCLPYYYAGYIMQPPKRNALAGAR